MLDLTCWFNMKLNKIILIFLGVLFALSSKATHIVGGSLTYIYNGGSSYNITLKLYRDCGPNTAQFPNTVTITVLGFNGSPFSPSRDITMNLGTITPVPSNLDTCADQPNPMPCTQEGIYTTTVNNLPPNPGGYHLYYQLIARNLSLTNVDAICNCVGESFYAYIPGPDIIWSEDFNLPNGTTVNTDATPWSSTVGTTSPSSIGVQTQAFQTTGANNATATWTSGVVNISPFTGGVNLQAALSETGTLDANDSIKVFYILNGGALTPFTTNGSIADDFNSALASVSNLVGSTIQIVIKIRYDGSSPASEVYKIDNISIGDNNMINNSNPVFDLFPPLFLCVNQPFTFDHSATDANGDSLVYEFYTPYNGDNNAGPLDPTFANNVAVFTPVTFQPGFTTIAPLGAGPFSLNSSTGLLTGTPPALGQFVVGVLVKEYRNGVYLSSTLRDFQFNVINCPQFSPAVLSPVTSCNSNTVSFSNLGGSSGSNWLWNFGDLTTNADQSTLNNPSYTYPAPGTYNISLTTGVGTTCANTATASLTIASILASFTSNAPRCVGTSVSFTSTSTTSSNTSIVSYQWSFGDNTTSAAQNPNHTYATSGNKTVTLTITDSNGCTSTATVVIVINPLPIINAGVNQTVCANNAQITLAGSVTNVTGGVWTSNGSGTFSPSNTALNAIYTPSASDISQGVLRFILASNNSSICSIVRDTMFVTITSAPTPANAGADMVICGTSIANLTANSPTIGTGAWSVISGTANISNASAANTTVTGLAAGSSYTLQWTVSSPGCIPSTDNVVVNVDLNPTTANAGTDKVLCNITTAAMTANAPSVGTGAWSIVFGSANITNPTSPTSTVSSLVPGTTTILRWTITQGVCTSTDDVNITINQPAIVNAGADQSYCTPTNIQLNGSVAGPTTTGTWSTLGNGTFIPSANALNATYVLGSNDISNGLVRLILTSTNNSASCLAVTDTMQVVFLGFNGTPTITTNNVSCFGINNGSATVNITNGISTYSYSWSTNPLQTNATATGLAPGNYSVTITDANGCTTQLSTSISQPPILSVTNTNTNINCFGSSTGSITANPSGGTAPYTYIWTPGNITTQTISNLPIGSYTVQVTDSKGCIKNATSTLTQSPALTATNSTTDVSCFGGNNGTVSVVAIGGIAPYNYTWTGSSSTSSTSSNASGLSANTYVVTITDALLCTLTQTFVIAQPTQLVVSQSSTNESCSYLNNGTATVIASGGTPNYTYLWSPGGMQTSSVTGLQSGNYAVVTTDAKGCQQTNFVSIAQPALLTANMINQVNVSCFGGNNASVSVNAAGGTPAYSYNWLPGGMNTSSVSNLTANTYTVTVSDVNGCTATSSVTITQPSAALTVSIAKSDALCFGSNTGSIITTTTGGTPNYSYTWTPGNIHSQNLSNLAAGNYSVVVVDSKGCSASNNATISQPFQIVLNSSSVTATCSQANGQASVLASGGSGSFSYVWSPSGGTNSIATGLFSGSYSVTVSDANGCSASDIVNVNDATGPSITIIGTTNVTCNGGNDGTATATVSSGTGPFTYSWQPSGGNAPIATGLTAGVYTLTVIDANNCQSLATTSPPISEPTALTIDVTHTNLTCNESDNGSATAAVFGGTPGYSYLWSVNNDTNATVTNLPAGNYFVVATDANGCTINSAVSISQPQLLQVTTDTIKNISCLGGSDGEISLNVSGGSPFYSYAWSPVIANGNTISNLAAGSYSVQVTDVNGCTTSTVVTLTQPASALSVTTTSNSTSCFGNSNGTASALASGGIAPYQFQWSPSGGNLATASSLPAGNYTVLVTDNKGCQSNATVTVVQPLPLNVTISGINATCGFTNGSVTSQINGGTAPFTYTWSNGSTSQVTLSNVSAGSYTVQVTDANGCSASSFAPVTLVNIPGPTAAVQSVSAASCNGGSNGTALAQITLGTPPYAVSWAPLGGSNLLASSLPAGNYTVTATDANGCTSQAIAIINQPSAITISPSSVTNVSCFGGNNGSIIVNVTGGSSPYAYSWTPVTSTSQILNNLSAGNYTVTVLDNNSCSTSISIPVSQPTQLLSSISSTINAFCFGGTGAASAIAQGGTLPYSYSWATNPVQSTSTALNLPAGPTIVTITDAKGCTSSATANVGQPTQIITAGGNNSSVCLGSFTTITATATGTAGGSYIYTWQPNGIVNNGTLAVAPLTPTNYTVTATDQNGCVGTTDTVFVDVYSLASGNLNITGNALVCPGGNTQLTASLTGSSGPVTYNWNNGLGATPGPVTVSPTQPTLYILTVSNSCGTTLTDSLFVDFSPPPTFDINLDVNQVCVPGTIQFTGNAISGNPADPIITYLWQFGDGTTSSSQNPSHYYSTVGGYLVTLTVTTQGGCTSNNANSPLVINAYPYPNASFTLNSQSLELPDDDLICNNTSTGATSYLWTFGDVSSSTAENPTYTFNDVGIFPITLIATSEFGCSDTATSQVITNSNIEFPTAFTPNPNGASGGKYDANSLDNDVFFPYLKGAKEYQLEIFNRWGELVFESNDYSYGWDGYYKGNLCQSDVYVWKLNMTFKNGKSKLMTGDVTLLR